MRVVIGGRGKMGQLLAAEAERAGFEVMGMFDAFNLDTLKEMEPADMLIDFSHRDNLSWILDYVSEHNCSLVYGTTGLDAEQKASLQKLSENHPVFFSANYSYGVAVLQEIIRTAAPLLKDSFDIELTETHHNQKQDAPSGTAKALLEILNPENEFKEVYGRSGMTGARQKEIGIHSLRGGTEAGEHTVHFFGSSEHISITHHADSRMIFVSGAIKAAQFLQDMPAGMYTMQDLVFQQK